MRRREPGALTSREQQVLAMLKRGYSNRDIANELSISLSGAKYHVSEIISKLGVSSRKEGAAWQPQRRWRLLPAGALLPALKRGGAALASIKAVAVAAVVVVAALALIVALGRHGSDGGGGRVLTAATPAAQPAGKTPDDGIERNVGQAVSGRLVSVEAGSYFVDDGEREVEFVVTQDTLLDRGEGHMMVEDHDLSRLQPGDSLFVAAKFGTSPLVAELITANGFIGRDGLIAAIGPDYLDVRLRGPEIDDDFSAESTRFLLDPSLTIQGGGGVLPLSALSAGERVQLQGFLAEDGALVALYIFTGS
jgi:DNA-binding CsgD family transcriptional regulator